MVDALIEVGKEQMPKRKQKESARVRSEIRSQLLDSLTKRLDADIEEMAEKVLDREMTPFRAAGTIDAKIEIKE